MTPRVKRGVVFTARTFAFGAAYLYLMLGSTPIHSGEAGRDLVGPMGWKELG
jgi:hypothetical protein